MTDIALLIGTAIGYLLSPLHLIIICLCGMKIKKVKYALGISFLLIFIIDSMTILFLSDSLLTPASELAKRTIIGLPFAVLLTLIVFRHYDKKRRAETNAPASRV